MTVTNIILPMLLYSALKKNKNMFSLAALMFFKDADDTMLQTGWSGVT